MVNSFSEMTNILPTFLYSNVSSEFQYPIQKFVLVEWFNLTADVIFAFVQNILNQIKVR